MRLARPVLALLLFPALAYAQPVLIQHPELVLLAAQVSPERERATDTGLAGFGTRHTLSDTVSETRGIGSDAPLGSGAVFRPVRGVWRLPGNPDPIADLHRRARSQAHPGDGCAGGAPGAAPAIPGRVIVISAHMDSRNSDALDGKGDAPGANDDAAGVSAVLEAARILSARKFPATIVYAVLTGEEQGLLGGKVLADYAVAQGWRVEAGSQQRHHRQQSWPGRG